MGDKNVNYLVVLDFAFSKFEVKFTGDTITPYAVLEQVLDQIFPIERKYGISDGVEDHTKLCLYRGRISETPCLSTELAYVFWPIHKDELDYNQFQFFVFRPIFNVHMTIHYGARIGRIIFPVKKSILYLKNYIRDKSVSLGLLEIPDYDLEWNGQILRDNEYTQANLNDAHLQVIAKTQSILSPYSLGRFYYFVYGQGMSWEKCANNTTIYDSLDFDENHGLTLLDAKRKLIEKHQNGQSMSEERVIIIFNGLMQTNKFMHLNDLLCDYEFYKFIVIFESSDMKLNSPHIKKQHSANFDDRIYDVPFPPGSRFLFIHNFDENTNPRPRPDYVMKLERPSLRPPDEHDEPEIPNPPSQAVESHAKRTQIYDEVDEEELLKSIPPMPQVLRDLKPSDIQPVQPTQQPADAKAEGEQQQNQESHYPPLKPQNYPAENEEDNEQQSQQQQQQENEEDNSHPMSDEYLLDMFVYYFTKFQESEPQHNEMPPPSYFRNMSPEDESLISMLTQYCNIYESP